MNIIIGDMLRIIRPTTPHERQETIAILGKDAAYELGILPKKIEESPIVAILRMQPTSSVSYPRRLKRVQLLPRPNTSPRQSHINIRNDSMTS
jgi:hypothetical protein